MWNNSWDGKEGQINVVKGDWYDAKLNSVCAECWRSMNVCNEDACQEVQAFMLLGTPAMRSMLTPTN